MQAQKTLDGFLKASFPRARNPTRKRKDPPKKIKREQPQPEPVPSIALPVTFVAAHPPRPSFPVLPRTPIDFSSFCVVPSTLAVETKDAVPAEIMLQHQHRACHRTGQGNHREER